MESNLRKALQSSATFRFENPTEAPVKMALLPGIYDASGSTGDRNDSASNLANAGYAVDMVADDFNGDRTDKTQVQVNGINRVRFRDFLNTVNRLGIKVSRIIIKNHSQSQEIFDQEIEVSNTAVGTRGAFDFIQLQDYVSVNAYDRTKIEIDLSNNVLYLGPSTYMAMTLPAGCDFSMKFVFEA